MGRSIVAHGFRATFRVWAIEVPQASREVCEDALAHTESDNTVAAYADRARLLDKSFSRSSAVVARPSAAFFVVIRPWIDPTADPTKSCVGGVRILRPVTQVIFLQSLTKRGFAGMPAAAGTAPVSGSLPQSLVAAPSPLGYR